MAKNGLFLSTVLVLAVAWWWALMFLTVVRTNFCCFLCFIELISEETEEEEDKEHTCETLLMCIVTVLSHGLRSGGGVGDVLRKPSKEVNCHHI